METVHDAAEWSPCKRRIQHSTQTFTKQRHTKTTTTHRRFHHTPWWQVSHASCRNNATATSRIKTAYGCKIRQSSNYRTTRPCNSFYTAIKHDPDLLQRVRKSASAPPDKKRCRPILHSISRNSITRIKHNPILYLSTVNIQRPTFSASTYFHLFNTDTWNASKRARLQSCRWQLWMIFL